MSKSLSGGLRTRDCRTEVRDADIDALNSLAASLGAGVERQILLRGDGDVWKRSADPQRFVMSVTQVRSILDILESGDADTLKDSFRNALWYWREVERKDVIAASREGDTDREADGDLKRGWGASQLQARMGPLNYDLPMEQREHVGKAQAAGGPPQVFVDYSSRDAIVGLSVGAESAVFGDEQSRLNAALDLTLYTKSYQARSVNHAITLVFSTFGARRDNGFGIGGRYGVVSPATELAVSIPVHVQRIRPKDGPGRSFTRPSIGIRLDAGFTSFLTFYLEIKRASAIQRDGTIRSGPAIGAGIQIAAPRCRLLHNCH